MRIALPEQVWLDLKVAGFGSRALAYIIDFSIRWLTILAVLLSLLVIYSFMEASGDVIPEAITNMFRGEDFESDSATHLIALMVAFVFVVEWIYPVYFEVYRQGVTPGKGWLGLRVVDEAGLPVTFQSSALRTLLLVVDMLPACGFVALVSMLMSKKSQRLGDIVGKTLVVYDIDRVATSEDIPTSAGNGAILLPVKHYNLLERFLQRKDELEHQAMKRAASELLEVMTPFVEQSGATINSRGWSASEQLQAIYQNAQPRKD